MMRSCCSLIVCLFATFSLALAAGQDTVPFSGGATNYVSTVSSAQKWTDTNVDLVAGQVISFAALPVRGNCSPQGTESKQQGNLLLTGAAPGALIGRIGTGAPFLVGDKNETKVAQSGRLYLAMNAGDSPTCDGELSVKLGVTTAPTQTKDIKSKLAAAAQTWLGGQFGTGSAAGSTSSGIASSAPGSGANSVASAATAVSLTVSQTLDAQLGKDLGSVPRRVLDEFKNQGDMVNFAVVGSLEQLQKALTAASWHVADQTKESAIANAILTTYGKQDYVQMPMSTLYLYGRPQDFGYEQAEAYSVVASRHHFRIWKAPFTYNGQTIWVGAGTHDIGFERDQRNGKVTHKIDPAVDAERDHIGTTLQKAGSIKSMAYYLPSDPVQDARNATGGSYHSDGRLLVMFLK